MSRTLWLVRHADTIWTGTDAIAGRTDVALSAEGRARLDRLRQTLTAPCLRARWFASPLSRTRESAECLLGARRLADISFDSRLVELDFGEWEGSTWTRVHDTQGDALNAWGQNWIDTAPPGGESFRQQYGRCADWFDEAVGAAGDERDIVVVTHGGCIRALLCHALEWPLCQAMRWSVDPACVFRVSRNDGDRRWRLRAANHRAFCERR